MKLATVRSMMVALLPVLVLVAGFACRTIAAVSVQSDRLVLDVKRNEPVVFRLEVTSDPPLGRVDLRADKLRIQREIRDTAANRCVFAIEPDTSQPGQVNGQIEVVDETGATLCAVPVSGEVKPWMRVSPARFFLGSIEGDYPLRTGERKSCQFSAQKRLMRMGRGEQESTTQTVPGQGRAVHAQAI